MKSLLSIAFCFLFLENIAIGQSYTISGYIQDKISGEFLTSATCFEMTLKKELSQIHQDITVLLCLKVRSRLKSRM
jgi:hypothetical protein